MIYIIYSLVATIYFPSECWIALLSLLLFPTRCNYSLEVHIVFKTKIEKGMLTII